MNPFKLKVVVKKRFKHWRSLLFQGLLLVLILAGLHLYQTRDAAMGPAPALEGVGLAGIPLSLEGLWGQPVLVHFWTTWCPVCRLELGSIDSLAKDYAVLTVAMEDTSPERISSYMREHQVKFPVLRDPHGAMARQYGVKAVPTSFVVDAQGEIHSVSVGYTTELGLRMRLWLASLSAENVIP